MPVLTIPNVRIAGLAAAVPALQERSWEELALSNGQCAVARKRNKTPFRRKAQADQCQSDLCLEAAKELMAGLGWRFSEIEAVVMATVTPDYPIPPTAIILQDRLGIPKTAVAFDLPAAGMGFLHALQVAASFVSTGFMKKALLFAGNVSKTTDESEMGGPVATMVVSARSNIARMPLNSSSIPAATDRALMHVTCRSAVAACPRRPNVLPPPRAHGSRLVSCATTRISMPWRFRNFRVQCGLRSVPRGSPWLTSTDVISIRWTCR